jgi:hypothetical protein
LNSNTDGGRSIVTEREGSMSVGVIGGIVTVFLVAFLYIWTQRKKK